MRNLYKKIGVGVLISGLLICGVNFSGVSVSHASSSNDEYSLESIIKAEYSKLGIELPLGLEAFLNGDIKGVLDAESNALLRPRLSEIHDQNEKEILGNVFGFRDRGNYSVIGFESGDKRYSISYYEEYWSREKSQFIKINYDRFAEAARKGNLKKIKLNKDNIYNVKISDKSSVLIVVF